MRGEVYPIGLLIKPRQILLSSPNKKNKKNLNTSNMPKNLDKTFKNCDNRKMPSLRLKN